MFFSSLFSVEQWTCVCNFRLPFAPSQTNDQIRTYIYNYNFIYYTIFIVYFCIFFTLSLFVYLFVCLFVCLFISWLIYFTSQLYARVHGVFEMHWEYNQISAISLNMYWIFNLLWWFTLLFHSWLWLLDLY